MPGVARFEGGAGLMVVQGLSRGLAAQCAKEGVADRSDRGPGWQSCPAGVRQTVRSCAGAVCCGLGRGSVVCVRGLLIVRRREICAAWCGGLAWWAVAWCDWVAGILVAIARGRFARLLESCVCGWWGRWGHRAASWWSVVPTRVFPGLVGWFKRWRERSDSVAVVEFGFISLWSVVWFPVEVSNGVMLRRGNIVR